MELTFVYVPTHDLDAALALYRDGLGFDELWREGELTVALAVPGGQTALMIDAAAEPGSGPGPMFAVERVDAWFDQHGGGLDVVQPPSDIPGGRVMAFRDRSGNHIYVFDQSTADDAGPG